MPRIKATPRKATAGAVGVEVKAEEIKIEYDDEHPEFAPVVSEMCRGAVIGAGGVIRGASRI